MRTHFLKSRLIAAIAILGVGGFLAGCKEDWHTVSQSGYRGTGMVQISNTAAIDKLKDKNKVPPPEDPADPNGTPATTAYQNIQVLTDLNDNDVMRLMAAMTNWVAPEQGCTYCHNADNLADDSVYAKKVARQMIMMVRTINKDWGKHVGFTGVTCYTCHRGNPVPSFIWFPSHGPKAAGGMAAQRQNEGPALPVVGDASLSQDPLTPLLGNPDAIHVQSKQALVAAYTPNIKNTEVTYGLMMHISQSLGVNCTFCHNSRAFGNWQQSNPQRVTAWYGLRMVSALNKTYLDPVAGMLPASHLGPDGAGPKVGCETCHQGVSKPLYGAAMAKPYTKELGPISGPGDQAKN
jgi:photosynthetic reaction center cytochrome c subunit